MPDPYGACRRQDLRAHILAVRRVPCQLDSPGRTTAEAKVDDRTVDVADVMRGRIVLDPGRFLDRAFASESRLSLISVGRMS